MRQVVDTANKYFDRPPRAIGNGKTVQDVHGFVRWLWGLEEGWSHLPQPIPAVLVERWRDQEPKNSPSQRCEDCRVAVPANYQCWFEVCPFCGGRTIYWADFSRRAGHFVPH
jgi:hypothetical protein